MLKDITIHIYVDGDFRGDTGCQINFPSKVDEDVSYRHWLPCSIAVSQWREENIPDFDLDQVYYKGRMMGVGSVVAEIASKEYAQKIRQKVLDRAAENSPET